MSNPPLKPSAQLYTVRNEIESDFAAVLHQIRAIGFQGAELAGYGNLGSAAAVKKAFDAAGLVVSGAHVSIDAFEKSIDDVIRDQKILNNTEVIIPWLPEERYGSAEHWRKLARQCNAFGARVAQDGLHLSYHNHAFEFTQYDGKTGWDIFLEHSDPAIVGIELDVYWVKRAGLDPLEVMKNLGSRLRLVHLKDVSKGPEQNFAPVGTGVLDFPTMAAAAALAGVKWGVVEQDDCYGMPPIESLRTSFSNLTKLKLI